MKSLLAKIIIPNGTVLGVVTMTQIQDVLKVGLLLASLVYTVLQIGFLVRKELRRK